jgi:hypothetical protein
MSPLREALGAGLGRAEAVPMVRVVTVPRELNPVPVTTIVSSTEAEFGVIVRLGLGVENSVELPTTSPTVTDTICVPGLSEPPAAAAGTSTITENAPSASVRMPAVGIALTPPIVIADAVVAGGKDEPVSVTVFPVEALAGVIVTAPLGIEKLIILELLVVAVAPPTVSALSVTFM